MMNSILGGTGVAIHYHCRHCGTQIGSIEQSYIQSETLGLHKLTNEERQEMVAYDESGNMLISAICEDCQEALERNPDFHQYDFLIH
jgi:hypothetical protein